MTRRAGAARLTLADMLVRSNVIARQLDALKARVDTIERRIEAIRRHSLDARIARALKAR